MFFPFYFNVFFHSSLTRVVKDLKMRNTVDVLSVTETTYPSRETRFSPHPTPVYRWYPYWFSFLLLLLLFFVCLFFVGFFNSWYNSVYIIPYYQKALHKEQSIIFALMSYYLFSTPPDISRSFMMFQYVMSLLFHVNYLCR